MTPIPKVLLAVLILVPIALLASANEEPPRTDPVDWLEEAKALATAGDHPGALDAAHRARELNAARPDELRRRFHGAIRQLVQKKLELARLMVEQVTLTRRLDPQDDTLPKLQQDALRGFSEAYALFAYLGRERDAAEAALAKADLHHDLGQAGSAADCLEAAGKAFEAADELLDAAAAWAQAAEARLDSDPAASVSAFRRAAELSSRGGNSLQAGKLFAREGAVKRDRQGDFLGALRAYGKARRAFEAAGEPKGVQAALMMQVLLAATLGEGDPEAYEALAVDPELKSVLLPLRLFGDAMRLKRLGRLEEALSKLERADQAAAVMPETDLEVSLFREAIALERSQILLVIPRLGEAILALREARRWASERGDPASIAGAWSSECEALESIGDGALASACWDGYREAGFEREVEAPAPTWRSKGERALRDLDMEEAERIFRDADVPIGVSIARVFQAALLFQNGEIAAARRALSQVDMEDLREVPLLSGFAQILAAVDHAAEGRVDETIESVRRGLQVIGDAWRTGLLTQSQKRFLLDILAPVYQGLVGALNELDRPYETLEVAEAGRARALLDGLGGDGADRDSADPDEIRRSRESLEAELAEVEQALRRAAPADRRALEERRAAVDRQLDSLRLEILLRRHRDGRLAVFKSSADRDTILGTVRRAGPVLYYYWIDGGTLLTSLLLPGEEEVFRSVKTGRVEELLRRIERFARGAANPLYEADALTLGSTLYRWLLEPLAEHIPPDGPLVIVPHGPLHELPFAALTDEEGVPLGEKYNLSIAPSLSILGELQSQQPAAGAEALLALASGRSLGLPLYEVRQVAGLFPAATILDSGSATAGAYRDLAPTARQLFIASRATADPGDQRLTYVEVDRDETHDSRLTAAEIATIPIAVDLVTLAACDTARSNPVLSDEQLDLSRAFLLAGSASVLATRWKLPEADRTTRFLEDFYRLYRNGGPDGTGLRKDEALRQAIARSRRRGDPAQIWAAWVLVGDGR